jgi:prepilin-type N-terminal cleavage/methylation domain-containing protein
MNKTKSFKLKISGNKSGFTLAELIVSLFIISAITAIFLTDYKGGNRSGDLNLSVQQLASNIRLAQNKALGSTKYNGNFPKGGWGVHVDTTNKNNYIIFADVNGNKIHDISPDEGSSPALGGQSVVLPDSIIISSITSNDQMNPNPGVLDITFLPPDPTTILKDEVGTSSVAVITLRNTVTNKTATVTVNALGLAQVN